jgi:2-phospho-L-lactate/phosphoenolpyruvate guanylyltransferase
MTSEHELGAPDMTWLLIPVKPFVEGKSRLSPVLDAGERAALSRQLLENVLMLAQASALFAEILVVSRDESALMAAEQMGARGLREPQPEGIQAGAQLAVVDTNSRALESSLNQALNVARYKAIDAGAAAVLVLPADLPVVTREDLHALLEPARAASTVLSRVVTLAPSHDGGTNALLLRPPDAIPFAFGPQSFARHRALAEAAGCAVSVVCTPSLAYDLDLPEDLWGEDLGI